MPATYSLITSQTLTTTASTISLSSIPQTYTDLVLTCSINCTADGDDLRTRVGNSGIDSTSKYSLTNLREWNALAESASGTNLTYFSMFGASGPNPYSPSTIVYNLLNYSNTTTYKTITLSAQEIVNGTPYGEIVTWAGRWSSTSAITNIQLFLRDSTFASGSTVYLYGIKAA